MSKQHDIDQSSHLTIHENLRHHVAVRPDKLALVYEDRTLTFGELYDESCRIASGLQKAGIDQGDKVGIFMRNHWAYVANYYAISMLGAVAVPINYMLRSEQLAALLELTGCSFLFTEPELRAEVEALPEDRFGELMICWVDGVLEKWVTRCVSRADEQRSRSIKFVGGRASPRAVKSPTTKITARGDARPPTAHTSIYDPMMILFSSGTTGLPKGITLSHLNRILYFFELGMEYGLRYDEVNLCSTPLYHNAAIFFAFNNLYFGSTVVVQRKFEPLRTFQEIETRRVTNAFLVPTQLHQLIQSDERSKFDLSSLRVIVSGAAPLATATKEDILRCFPGVELHELYGLTETGLITNLRPADQLRKVRCAGQAFLNMEFRIVDPDGKPVATNEVGEIVTRGATLFDGYYGNPEATAAAWRNGWFHTGDLGRVDDEGFLYIVDRLKDMILSGGVNIYPKDIEDIIYGLPQVKDAAVIGIPDEKWGEAVHALVVCRDGTSLPAEQVLAHCKARLAAFQVPRSVEFRPELPRNPSGKLLKRVLREEFWGKRQEKV